MTDHFPRIFSISTVNFKQHYNSDYLLHKHRTDFSGDSGCGKSMIADILQLILAGAPSFQSSTSGTDKRTPQGMLLQQEQRRSTGYAFLNVEVIRNKFLVIGTFIETSHNHVRPFIIQGGFDWTQLSVLDKPISYKSFIDDEKVHELDDLKDSFSGGLLKSFTWKEFQKILFNNQLLSFDLTDSKNADSYASILRSFSRGKGFKTDSASLKDFIFGSDEKLAIWQKYQEDIKAIDNDLNDHQRFINESELIRKKQDHIKNVVAANQEYEKLKREYLSAKCACCNNQSDLLAKELGAHNEKLEQASFEVEVMELKGLKLTKSSLEELQNLYKKLENLDSEKITDNYVKLRTKIASINKVELWLSTNNFLLNDLIKSYQSQIQLLDNKALITKFIEHLSKFNKLDEFETSEWLKDYESEVKNYPSRLEGLEGDLDDLKALSVFSEITNKHSLAAWAMNNLKPPLSIEIESALVYFQTLPRTQPESENGKRYLPFPEKLFSDFNPLNSDEKGFWIELNGVHEYIENIQTPLLNIEDYGDIKNKLHNFSSNIKAEIDELELKIQTTQSLKSTLDEFDGSKEAIKLYTKKQQLLSFDASEYAKLSEEEFNSHIESFNNKGDLNTQYKASERLFSELNDIGIEQKQKLLIESFNFKQNQIETGQIDRAIELVNNSYQKKLLYVEQLNSEKTLDEKILAETFNIYTLPQKKASVESQKNSFKEKVATCEKLLIQAEINKETASDDFKSEYFEDFDSSIIDLQVQDPDQSDNGKSLKQAYESAEIRFQEKYDFTKTYVENDTLIRGYSVGELAHRILPNVFPTSDMDEGLIDERIDQRLHKLATDIHKIGSRKVDILASVIESVLDAYHDYIEKVKAISSYLKNHSITGGNKASLEYKLSTDFPPGWIFSVRKQLRNSAPDFGLFEGAEQTVNVNDIIIGTFHQETAKTSVVDIKDLLNPKSYFDLSFSLELPKGKKNAGSNGQTYTANALLALAKLSMIENQKSSGIKIMPIDEAEGLGSNYDLLHDLAKQEGYQVISMSIETAGDINSGEQYIYTLSNNEGDPTSYVPPLGIFVDDELSENISEYYDQVVSDI